MPTPNKGTTSSKASPTARKKANPNAAFNRGTKPTIGPIAGPYTPKPYTGPPRFAKGTGMKGLKGKGRASK